MKKFFYLIAIVLSSGFLFTACTNDDDPVYVDHDTVSTVYEYRNKNFNYDSVNGSYYFYDIIDPVLHEGEMVLIYMSSAWDTSGNKTWVLLPNEFYYYYGGNMYNLYANFEFFSDEFRIDVYPNVSSLPSQFVGVTFRVMIIPANITYLRGYAPPVDYRDYNAVVKYFKIDESKIIQK